jgi:hypothetical protein
VSELWVWTGTYRKRIKSLSAWTILVIITVFQISEINGLMIICLSAMEFVFGNASYKYGITWYCVFKKNIAYIWGS